MTTASQFLPGDVRAFKCPSCGGTITLRAVGISVDACCAYCHAIIDVTNSELTYIKETLNNQQTVLYLPIGSRGTLYGIEWEVIGYMERSAIGYGYSWSEYLLYNPWHGFRFLVEDHGHWNYVKMIPENFEGQLKLTYQNHTYKSFTHSEAMVTFVLGEFYWRVKVGEAVSCHDLIAPPFMISREESHNEVTYSHAHIIAPSVIKSAFKVSHLPSARGIAANAVNPFSVALDGKLWMVACLAVAILFTIFMAQVSHMENEVVYSHIYHPESVPNDIAFASDDFNVPGSIGNLAITLDAPVDNNWLDIEGSLHNNLTSENDFFDAGVSYYHGRDSDGYWSEGSTSKQILFSKIAGGSYKLITTAHQGNTSIGIPVRHYADLTREHDLNIIDLTHTLMLAAPLLHDQDASLRSAGNTIYIWANNLKWDYINNRLPEDTFKSFSGELKSALTENPVQQNRIDAWYQAVKLTLLENATHQEGLGTGYTYTLRIIRNHPDWLNFWAAAVAIFIFPLIMGLLNHWFESRRWANS